MAVHTGEDVESGKHLPIAAGSADLYNHYREVKVVVSQEDGTQST